MLADPVLMYVRPENDFLTYVSIFIHCMQVKHQSFYKEIINSDAFEKTLRLVISFGHIKRAQFVSALEERLAPPLR